MGVLLFQLLNTLLVLLILGVPVVVVWLFFRRVGFKRDLNGDLIDKIRELEERVRQLEAIFEADDELEG